MTWFRHDCGAGTSDLWQDLADAIKRHRQHAKGCYWDMCEGFGLHRRDGHMASVKDQVLEQWAHWDGKKGAWAVAVRARCQDEDGFFRGWERQLKLLEKQERDRESARKRQREVRENFARTSRNASREVLAHTNERTNKQTENPPDPPSAADAAGATWLTPWLTAYERSVGSIAPGHLAKVVRPVHDADPTQALRSFRNWCEDQALRRYCPKVGAWAQRWRDFLPADFTGDAALFPPKVVAR